jgi:hypothetical protein
MTSMALTATNRSAGDWRAIEVGGAWIPQTTTHLGFSLGGHHLADHQKVNHCSDHLLFQRAQNAVPVTAGQEPTAVYWPETGPPGIGAGRPAFASTSLK